MRNTLQIEWKLGLANSKGFLESYKGIKSQDRAMDVVLRKNIDNINRAVWYDADGEANKLIPIYVGRERMSDPETQPVVANDPS